MAEDFQRRLPSKDREIKDITPDDVRVAIIGTVIDLNDDATRFVIDDGTGKVTVTSDSPLKGEANQLVRVLGRVIPLENGVEIQGDVMQDMKTLDMGLYKRVKGLKI